MNSKDLKIAVNSIRLPEESRERIIRELEKVSLDGSEQMESEEYDIDIVPVNKTGRRHTMAVVSVCAVLAVAFVGIYVSGRDVYFPPAADIPQQSGAVNEAEPITPEMFGSFLIEYNQEHGTQLRFATEEEYTMAGTTEEDCFAFFAEFLDKESFLQYVDVLVSKGETVISNFHRANLYDSIYADYGSPEEWIGYHYFFYNTSGQTYGIIGVDGLKLSDYPDLISCIGDNGAEGYILKTDWDEFNESPESPDKIDEWKAKQAKKNHSLNVYTADGKTIIDTFTMGKGERIDIYLV